MKLTLGIVALGQASLYAMEKSNLSSTALLEKARLAIQYQAYKDVYIFLKKAAALNDRPFSELAKIGMRLTQIETLQDSAIDLERKQLFNQSIDLLTNAIETKGYTEGYLFLGDIYLRQSSDSQDSQQQKELYTKALTAYTTGSNKGSVLCKLWMNFLLLLKAQDEKNMFQWTTIFTSMLQLTCDLEKQYEQETDPERKKIFEIYFLSWKAIKLDRTL